MAITKNAYLRYQVLDKCFSNPMRSYTFTDLLEKVNEELRYDNPDNEGIKTRQLRDDIRFMRSESGFGIELEDDLYIGRKKVYRYQDPEFSISKKPINTAEAESLKAAMHILSRFSGLPQFSWLDEMLPLLEDQFDLSTEQNGKIISFESNIDYTGYQHIKPLFNAINHQRVLQVKYQAFTEPHPVEFYFHPYYLKQYNNRWFALGYHEEEEKSTWNLALDRILKLTETDRPYQKSDCDWEGYFDDIIGVTHYDEKPREVKLLFNKEVSPYVKTKPLHLTQKHKEVEQGLEVRIQVIPNFELEKLILSFGEQVKVLSPERFKERISKRLKSANRLY